MEIDWWLERGASTLGSLDSSPSSAISVLTDLDLGKWLLSRPQFTFLYDVEWIKWSIILLLL
jgi:hypothetical protein